MRTTLGARIHPTLITSLKSMVALVLLMIIAAALLATAQAATTASNDSDVTIGVSEITYRTRAGDTLTSIAERFTGAASNGVALGKINGVSNDTRIAVNTSIHIPADLLTDQPVTARVIALSGVVTATGIDKARTRLQAGTNVTEGMQIETSKNSFITLALVDASQISIPSNSVVQLTTLRTTRFTRSPRTAITILHGSIESVVSPLARNKGRYQIFSPSATAGVRGTHFRVAVLPDGRTANALFEGVIELEPRAPASRTAGATALAAGFGSVATSTAVGTLVKLLAAPQLSEAPAFSEVAEARFNVAPQAGAVAYHLQLATDMEARLPVLEARSASPLIALNNVVEGDYSIRLSAVDANGIEGFSRVIPVSLRRAASSARATDKPAAPYIGGSDPQQFTLKWLDRTDTKFRVQVAHDIYFKRLQYEIVVARSEINLPRPPLGSYYARVQRLKPNGSIESPFSDAQAFIVNNQWVIAEGMPSPARALADGDVGGTGDTAAAAAPAK